MNYFFFLGLILFSKHTFTAEQSHYSFTNTNQAIYASVALVAGLQIYNYACKKEAYSCNEPLLYAKSQSSNERVTLFAHGLGAYGEQAIPYHSERNIQRSGFIEGDLALFDFKDAGKDNPLWHSSLGQKDDMAQLAYAINAFPEYEIDLYGISRGASTIGNLAGTDLPQTVKSIVLESPFGHIKDVVKHKTGTALLTPLLGLISEHSMWGVEPNEVAANIKKDLPILILASEKDNLIPLSSSAGYYNKLRASGHNRCHLLTFKEGHHGAVYFDNTIKARNGIHAFYKKYKRPHNKEWADAAEKFFE